MRFGLSDSVLDMMADAFRAVPGLKRAVIFGSRSMGNQKSGSDVDLAIFGATDSESAVLRLSWILNEELPLPYRFDVIAYETITNDNLREHINTFGIIVYEGK